MPYPAHRYDSSRPTTESIRRLPPNQRLDVAIDQSFLWENLEDAWKAGADITRVSPGGATAWAGLAALLDAWNDYHWQAPEGEHRVNYLVEQSERLIEAGVPVDGNTQPGSSQGHGVSFLEAVARVARRLDGRLDPVMQVLLDAGANPVRTNAWHSAVEWCARDQRPDHPLRRWQVEQEQATLRASMDDSPRPAAPTSEALARPRPRI